MDGSSKKEFQLTETEKLMIYSTLLEAGSDTSRSAITQMIAGAAAFPEWQRTARAHLDEVCGSNAERLPSFADRERLPYISAVVKETLRWRPFIQTGVPRELTQDDTYEGYSFPAGTLFTWNAYALSLNDNDYEDAVRFMPERFLNKDLNNPLKGHWSFGTGSGSRMCGRKDRGCNADIISLRASSMRRLQCWFQQCLDSSCVLALLLRVRGGQSRLILIH